MKEQNIKCAPVNRKKIPFTTHTKKNQFHFIVPMEDKIEKWRRFNYILTIPAKKFYNNTEVNPNDAEKSC